LSEVQAEDVVGINVRVRDTVRVRDMGLGNRA
jgi:hypothetical protein